MRTHRVGNRLYYIRINIKHEFEQKHRILYTSRRKCKINFIENRTTLVNNERNLPI